MPELPEVEVLVRHLAPLLCGHTVRGVAVHRLKVIRPAEPEKLAATLVGARFTGVRRRAKFLLFELRPRGHGPRPPICLLGHLGMTGRMYLQPAREPLPRHAAVSLDLGRHRFVYEDPRYFGRFTTDLAPLAGLGPEPFAAEFTPAYLRQRLARSQQAIKVRLLDQALVAGVGNIYASEALFRARIDPRKPARRLSPTRIAALHTALRDILREAIECGSTLPLDFAGQRQRNGLFYYGAAEADSAFYTERLRVYDRADEACPRCRGRIRRLVQAARSTYFCPGCQRG